MQSNSPDPLFGAIQRMHPASQSKEKSLIFGSSLPPLPNPFNLNFEIPPLPSLSLLQQDLSQKDEVAGLATSDFSFFSYLTQKQKKSSPTRKRSPPGSPS
jgi:hypothetical protein